MEPVLQQLEHKLGPLWKMPRLWVATPEAKVQFRVDFDTAYPSK